MNCPKCSAPRTSAYESDCGVISTFACGSSDGFLGERKWVSTPECRNRAGVLYLSRFTTPGSCTENHTLANRAIEILNGEERVYA